MGDIRNVLESVDWRRRQEKIASAAAAEESTEFDELAASLDEGSVTRRVRTRGDAVILVKSLSCSDGEGPQWVDNFADAIMRRRTLLLKGKSHGKHEGDRPPEADDP